MSKCPSCTPELRLVLVASFLMLGLLVALRSGFSFVSYPWLFPDSYDWLVNGLRYSSLEGANFDVSHRAMFLPLVFSLLIRLGCENSVVFFGSVFHCATAVLVYVLARHSESRQVACWAALLFLISFTALGQSAFVGSDSAAHFFLVGTALSLSNYSRSGEMRWFTLALLSAAVGIHAQYIGVILAPALLACLCLYDSNQRLRCGFARFWQLACDRQSYLSVFAAGFVAALFLLPRLLEFHVIYTERVQHGSLVRWHIDQPLYYAAGLVSSFSWPVVLLSIIGIVRGVCRLETRRATIFYCLWMLDILLFFSFLYTWKDIRFLLYLAVPLFLCAAHGLAYPLQLSSVQSNPLRRLTQTLLVVTLAFYASAPSTPDPFDQSFAISPLNSASFDRVHFFERLNQRPLPYLLSHWEEASKERINRSSPGYDEPGYSAPLLALMRSLREEHHDLWASRSLYIFAPHLSPWQPYFVRNRNILYALKEVKLLTASEELPPIMEGSSNLLIVHSSDDSFLKERIPNFAALPTVAIIPSIYRVVLGGSPVASITEPAVRMPPFVARVLAAEQPAALFDGITDDPHNFAAAPLGEAIQVDFKQPVAISIVNVRLWNFDGRSYRFRAEGMDGASPVALGSWQGQGLVSIPVDGKALSGLRLIGEDNSNLALNPENRVMHVLELEIERSQ